MDNDRLVAERFTTGDQKKEIAAMLIKPPVMLTKKDAVELRVDVSKRQWRRDPSYDIYYYLEECRSETMTAQEPAQDTPPS